MSVDVSQRVVFAPAVEGLFVRSLSGQVGPELRAQLAALGLDLSRPLEPAYPLATWVQALRTSARALFPGEVDEAAHRRLGQQLAAGYAETLIGQAVFAVLRLIGPARALARTTKNFRTGNNYSECRLTERAPGDVTLWMNEAQVPPHFTAGIVEEGMRRAGAPDCSVQVESSDQEGITFRVRWAAR